jgi:ELWxxDGT repeat protein
MGLRRALPFAILGLLAGLPPLQAQPAFLVRDLNTSQPALQLWDRTDEMEALGSSVFFVRDDGVHGKELWVSDGSPGGPRLVRDILPGARSSSPSYLTVQGSLLFFIADDGVHGRELWRSDGTEAGTVLAQDFNPGPRGAVLSLAATGWFRMLSVMDFEVIGPQFVGTDGFEQGVLIVRPLPPGPPRPARVLSYSGQQVLYTYDDGAHGAEPWVFNDSQSLSTWLGDLRPGAGSSLDPAATPASVPQGADAVAAPWGGFVFTADDGAHGRELWRTDGTAAGTTMIKDISPGAPGSGPHGLTALNGAVYFSAQGPEGEELWKTDGTAAGTVLVKDLYAGGAGSSPQELTAVGGRLFFLAYDPTFGEQLFRSDGTEAGTLRMAGPAGDPLVFGFAPPGYGRHGLSDVNGRLLFFADDSSGGSVWTSDGITGASRVATIGSFAPVLMADGYAVAGGSLYLRGGAQGEEIWRSDGTAAGTVGVASILAPASSFFIDNGTTYGLDAFGSYHDRLFFQADTSGTAFYLWSTDGTDAGTFAIDAQWNPERFRTVGDHLLFESSNFLWVYDIPGGLKDLTAPQVFDLTTVGDTAFFASGYADTGKELWKTDGTQAGTTLVADLVPGTGSSNPQLLTAAGGRLFFQATTESAGSELWVSDGTAEGSFQVADLVPGTASSSPRNLTAGPGGLLFFTADTSGSGRELWKSDGTPGGTARVKDIRPGTDPSVFDPSAEGIFAAPAGGPLFFAANDGVNGEELWRSDGTDAGTVMVRNVLPNSFGSYPRLLTVVGARVFFVADDGTHGRELWVSDGTDAGTHLVKDIVPGAGSPAPYNLTALGSVLVFSAFDPDHGVEAWRSDGTDAGTWRLQDLAPGPLSSSPLGFTAAGPNLYFVADDNTHGFELWAIPKIAVTGTFADVPPNYWAWRFIEALAHSGVTGGCGGGNFCPDALVNRAQMAVFLLAARDGVPPPPATGTRFDDVPPGYWAGPWIEELAREGVVGGCSVNPPLYCPGNNLTRAEMAVLLTVARHETPPPATGTRFIDVPADYWAAPWIEQLAADGVTTGCGGGRYCPDQPITRGEMAVFLATAFHLPLP